MTKVSITIDDGEIQRAFAQLLASAGNVQPALKDIGEYMVREIDNHFAAEQAPDGTPWAPLTEATIALSYLNRGKNRQLKTKKGKITKGYERFKAARKILDNTGRLRASIAYQIEADGVAIGTNLIYANIHQFGGQAGRGRKVTIPARPFLGVTPQNRQEIVQILLRHLGGSSRA